MAKRKDKEEAAKEVQAVKGFDANWKCRGHQFEVGKSYQHDGKVEICNSGFHACTYPLDVFGYYAPADSKYAEVTLREPVIGNDGDSKIASAHITIKAEINLPDIVKRSVEWILSRIESSKSAGEEKSHATNTGYRSAATNTGDQSAATNTGHQSAATNTGYRSAATNTGDRSAATNTGDQSAATNTGDQSAATNTGDQSAATNTGYRSAATNTGYRSAATNTGYRSAATNTGDRSAATNTGYRSAATNTGDRSAATNTGDRSAATNTGYRSAATNTGDRSAATVGNNGSVAITTGHQSKARAGEGSAIVLCRRDTDGSLLSIRSSKVGENGIKPDVFYMLNDNDEFVEVES